MDRRDFLRYFGAGASIVPLVGGAELAVAKLIEVPKIEIIEPPKIEMPFYRDDVVSGTVTLRMKDGSTRTRDHFDFKFYPVDLMAETIKHYEHKERLARICPECRGPNAYGRLHNPR